MTDDKERFQTDRGASLIMCPFFHGHDGKRIRCEGFIDGIDVIQKCDNSETRKLYERTFCENHHHKYCWLYRNLMEEKYEEDLLEWR